MPAEDAPKQDGLRERIERIVSDLARRGEVRTRDIQKAARDLADRSARDRDELVRLIQKEFARQRQKRSSS